MITKRQLLGSAALAASAVMPCRQPKPQLPVGREFLRRRTLRRLGLDYIDQVADNTATPRIALSTAEGRFRATRRFSAGQGRRYRSGRLRRDRACCQADRSGPVGAVSGRLRRC
jgi:hypothetical protein